MFAVIEDATDRLVIKIGSKNGWNTALFSLDGAGKRIQVERRTMFMRRKTIDAAFDDLARIDAVTTKTKQNVVHSIILGFRSGKRRWCAGDTPGATAEAADRMRAFMQLKPAGASAGSPLSRPFRWATAALTGVAVVVGVIAAAAKISGHFFLPACDDRPVLDTLADLVAPGAQESASFDGVHALKITHAEKLCRAGWTRATGPVLVDYRLEWEGWSAMVRTIDVRTAEAVNAAKIAEVKEASGQILALARGSEKTGVLPEAAEPTVARNLDVVFDTASIDPAVFKDNDLPMLIDWFNAGHSVGATYVLASTGYHEFADVPAGAAFDARIARNVIEQAPVVGRYLDFEIRILNLIGLFERKQATASGAKTQPNPDFVTQLRGTLLAAVQTSLADLAAEGLTDAWRADRVAQIEAVIDDVKRFITKEQVLRLHDDVVETQSKLGNADLRKRLSDIGTKVVPVD